MGWGGRRKWGRLVTVAVRVVLFLGLLSLAVGKGHNNNYEDLSETEGKSKEMLFFTANEGPVRIQYKCLVPVYVYPEMKLHGLVIFKSEL
jgi:hypothetical protein